MKKIIQQRAGLGAGIIAIAGVLFSPVIASAVTANTTISTTVAQVVSVSSNGTVNISLTPTVGGVVSSASDTVTVSTNDTLGYTLTLADSNSNTDLVSGGNSITAHSGTLAVPTALTTGKWGYAIPGAPFDVSYSPAESNNVSSTSKWAGVPATGAPDTIKTTSSTASGDTTTVWYAAKVNATQPNGTYTDTVTYTATTN